jgi:RimJ/RimL family protein N-acetyltransferase
MAVHLETDRLIIRLLTEDDVEATLKVYEASVDFLDLQTTEPPSIEMARSDMQSSSQRGSVFAGIFNRASGELIGITDFVPKNFRGQSDYAWVSVLLIRESDRGQGFGSEAYRAVEDFIFGDPEVTRIGTVLVPQYEPALKFAEKLGFERAGGPFKNKRGYGLYSFVKKRAGSPETAGKAMWREAKKVKSDE